MPTLTTHQAVCLSFGLDPSKVQAYDHRGKSWGWLGNRLFNAVSDFNDRRTLFSACHPKGLSPEQLSKWAQSVNWNIPTMLADLAPVPVDAPDTLPAETVRAALVEVIGPGADIEELKKEIERTGITFSMRDGVETMEVPDGNLRGRRTPLSGLYNELRTIFYTMPKGSKLGSLMRASGASGGGTQPSYGLSHTPQKLAQTTAIPEPQQTAPATGTASEQSPKSGTVAEVAKPWLRVDPRDPNPEQHWYTPARYFARQLVIADTTLLTKKLILADKVSSSLAGVGIFKRGGKKPHKPDTVLKAFANVPWG